MRWLLHLLLALALAVLVGTPALAATTPWGKVDLVAADGTPMAPETLSGRVVLVVNVASFCTFTPQYADLQALHERYAARGFVVVGVPCNQFGGQEPGTDKQIRNFCETRYGVTFPLLAKQDVNGPTRSPLYRWLVDSSTGGGRDVGWNFEKFLVGRGGGVLGRFPSHVQPDDPRVIAAIELALDAAP